MEVGIGNAVCDEPFDPELVAEELSRAVFGIDQRMKPALKLQRLLTLMKII
ncbi:hypothetical protein D1BOALGB6SA_7182 [Olavius sp. associated proteobacterium Delta 1]|nr:hypothetical protein D1BOALGB6SA_7182 [Olavius sp. associated proteobacterium Delta 1]